MGLLSQLSRVQRASRPLAGISYLDSLLHAPEGMIPVRKYRFASRPEWRNVATIANALPYALALSNRALPIPAEAPHAVFDRRVFHPLGDARPVSLSAGADILSPERKRANPKNKVIRVPDGDRDIFVETRTGEILPLYEPRPSPPQALFFSRPGSVWECLKRKMRREVMHAFGHSGKSGQKKPVWGPNSRIRC